MTLIEAAKQAREALKSWDEQTGEADSLRVWSAIDALNQAIAEVEQQEPVGYTSQSWLAQFTGGQFSKRKGICGDVALYTSPPQPEQEPVAWVYPEGLEALKAGKSWTAYGTRQEPDNTALYLSPQLDIPPYAWVTFTPYGDEDDVWYENPEGKLLEGWTYKPLYDTTPPKREWQELTDEELEVLNDCGDTDSYQFAKAIEAKLKEKNGLK